MNCVCCDSFTRVATCLIVLLRARETHLSVTWQRRRDAHPFAQNVVEIEVGYLPLGRFLPVLAPDNTGIACRRNDCTCSNALRISGYSLPLIAFPTSSATPVIRLVIPSMNFSADTPPEPVLTVEPSLKKQGRGAGSRPTPPMLVFAIDTPNQQRLRAKHLFVLPSQAQHQLVTRE